MWNIIFKPPWRGYVPSPITTLSELPSKYDENYWPREHGSQPRDLGSQPRDQGSQPRDLGSQVMGSGSANFNGIMDQTLPRFWDQGSGITHEKRYLVMTLIITQTGNIHSETIILTGHPCGFPWRDKTVLQHTL